MTTETGAKSDAQTYNPVETTAEPIVAKRPYDIDEAIVKLREAVGPYPPAALFQLAEEGFASTFEQLLACIISIRTLDETTILCSHQLFAMARTPAQLLALGEEKLDALIHASTFHEAKTRQMMEIARVTLEQYGGELPCDFEVLTSFAGVGPKCAN